VAGAAARAGMATAEAGRKVDSLLDLRECGKLIALEAADDGGSKLTLHCHNFGPAFPPNLGPAIVAGLLKERHGPSVG